MMLISWSLVRGISFLFLVTFLSHSTGSYLVSTPACQIPTINPFEASAMKKLSNYDPPKCSPQSDLVKLLRNGTRGQFKLKVNPKFTFLSPKCCMQIATLVDDYNFKKYDCVYFTKQLIVPISAEYIIVDCWQMQNPLPTPKNLYKNVFFLVQEKQEIKKRYREFHAMKQLKKRAPSVLILGVDSLGRVNLERLMPKVFRFLKDNQFYDMKGFNKIGLNTYPNLMGSFAGVDVERADCLDSEKRADNCILSWKDYKNYGYATAYSEDYTDVGTFHYLKKGFRHKPVDHYGRTGLQLIEKHLMDKAQRDAYKCGGMRYLAEYMFSHGVEFAKFYKGQPYFGIFWTNTLSHDVAQQLRTLEGILLKSLEEAKSSGVLDDSIVIFMGDHGFRFDLNIYGGVQDDRLPPLFISLPQWYKDAFPDDAKGLEVNQGRLVTHYDLHITLEDILKRSGRAGEEISGHTSCPSCQSLFRPVGTNRTCVQVGVPLQFCMCEKRNLPDFKIDQKKAAEFLVDHVNKVRDGKLKELKKANSLCHTLRLDQSWSLGRVDTNAIMMRFSTVPGNASYEAVVKSKEDSFEIVGNVIRINMYKGHSDCVEDLVLKNLCECVK